MRPLPDPDLNRDSPVDAAPMTGAIRVSMTRAMAHDRLWALCEARSLLLRGVRKAERLGRHQEAAGLQGYADSLDSLASLLQTALHSGQGVHVEVAPKLAAVSIPSQPSAA